MSTYCDDIDEEFKYYSRIMLEKVDEFNDFEQTKFLSVWLSKLTCPAYNATKMREKRNLYMLFLCINLCNAIEVDRKLSYPFNEAPNFVLMELESLFLLRSPTNFNWEAEIDNAKVSIEKPQIEIALDYQFYYILHLAQAYYRTLETFEKRIKAAKWIQILRSATSSLIERALRNDYTMLLSGYLLNKHLAGPFKFFPTGNRLISLKEFCKISNAPEANNTNDFPKTAAEVFFEDELPAPSEGAFAFISFTSVPNYR